MTEKLTVDKVTAEADFAPRSPARVKQLHRVAKELADDLKDLLKKPTLTGPKGR